MWEIYFPDEFDDNLKRLYIEYHNMFGCMPDEYEDIFFESVTYDEMCKAIKKCLKKHKTMPHIHIRYDRKDFDYNEFKRRQMELDKKSE